jgi:hypothetical protein
MIHSNGPITTISLPRQRFRIQPRMKVRIGRLVKVLSILGPAAEGTANSHGFFEGGTEIATPFEGSTSRKIAMKIPGASKSIGRREQKKLRATCRRGPPHCEPQLETGSVLHELPGNT